MSANRPFPGNFKTIHQDQPQKTMDDEERVLPKMREEVLDHNLVTPRKRDALELYDRIQQLKLREADPLFD